MNTALHAAASDGPPVGAFLAVLALAVLVWLVMFGNSK